MLKTNVRKRKREPPVAKFDNGGDWFVFDGVDMEPGWNTGVYEYGKQNMSKENAIDMAKQACKQNGHFGFVVVGKWGAIFYKSADPAGVTPSLTWVNKGTDISLHLWLTTEQLPKWSTAETTSKTQAQNPEGTAANAETT